MSTPVCSPFVTSTVLSVLSASRYFWGTFTYLAPLLDGSNLSRNSSGGPPWSLGGPKRTFSFGGPEAGPPREPPPPPPGPPAAGWTITFIVPTGRLLAE